VISTLSANLQARAPRDDVEYLRTFAQLILTVALVAAVGLYLSRGGNVVRLVGAAETSG
jgi:hypothetical protein